MRLWVVSEEGGGAHEVEGDEEVVAGEEADGEDAAGDVQFGGEC